MKRQLEMAIKASFTWIDRITIIFAYISALFALLLTVIVFVSVMARYVFNKPFGWSDEICAYIFIFHCFLALAYATYKEANVAAEMLFLHFPPKVQLMITVIGYTLALICTTVICYYGFLTTYSYFTRGWASDTAYAIILWPILLMIPFGFLLFGLQCLSRLNAIIIRMRTTNSVIKEVSLFGLEKE